MRLVMWPKGNRNAALQAQAEAEGVRIYWITDTHWLADVQGDSGAPGASIGNRYFWTAEEKVDDFVAAANAKQPELVLHSGDMIEAGSDSIDEFMVSWSNLSVPLHAETIGNHDLANGTGGQPTHDDWVTALGYSGHTTNAGSKFNYDFVVSRGDFDVRVIMVDSNMTSGVHVANTEGRAETAVTNWVSSRLSATSEDVVLIIMHHGIHDAYKGYFDSTEAGTLAGLAETEIDGGRFVYTLFGHDHTSSTSIAIQNQESATLDGYNGVPSVDFEGGRYNQFSVLPSGEIFAMPINT